MEIFNWKVGGVILLLFMVAALLRAVTTDNTCEGNVEHYIHYLAILLIAVVETVVLCWVAR